jgi:hypothetical protein
VLNLLASPLFATLSGTGPVSLPSRTVTVTGSVADPDPNPDPDPSFIKQKM